MKTHLPTVKLIASLVAYSIVLFLVGLKTTHAQTCPSTASIGGTQTTVSSNSNITLAGTGKRVAIVTVSSYSRTINFNSPTDTAILYISSGVTFSGSVSNTNNRLRIVNCGTYTAGINFDQSGIRGENFSSWTGSINLTNGAGFTNYGTYTADYSHTNGTLVNATGGTFNWSTSNPTTGNGAIVNNGTLNMNNHLTIGSSTTWVGTGSLSVPHTFNINSAFTGGSITARRMEKSSSGSMSVSGNVTATDYFITNAPTTIGGNVNITSGDFIINSGATGSSIGGTVTVSDDLEVNARTTFTGAVTTTDKLVVGSGASNSSFGSNVTVGGDTELNAGISITGNLNANGNGFTQSSGAPLTVGGNLTIADTEFDFTATVNVTGNLTVPNNVKVTSGSTVTVGGNFSAVNDVEVNGNLTVNGNATVSDDVLITSGGNLVLNGANNSITDNFINNGRTTLGGTTTIGGDLTTSSGSTTNIQGQTSVSGSTSNQGQIINPQSSNNCASFCSTGNITNSGGTIGGSTGPLVVCKTPSSGNAVTSPATVATQPTAQPTLSGSLSPAGANVTGSFTAVSGASGYLILRRKGSAVSTAAANVPTNINGLTEESTFGVNTVAAIITSGSTTNFSDLIPGEQGCGTYHYAIFSYGAAASGSCTTTYGYVRAASPLTSSMTINTVTQGGSVANGSNVCQGDAMPTLSLGSYNGAIQRWEWSTDATFTTGVNTLAVTTPTYQPSTFAGTRYFRAIVQASGCATANAVAATVAVVSNPTATRWISTSSNGVNTCANWDAGIPVTSTNITIDHGFSAYPRLTAATTVANLNFGTNSGSNASIDLNGQRLVVTGTLNINSGSMTINNGTLEVRGPITGSGTLTGGSTARLEIRGSGTLGTLRINQAARTFKSIIFNRSGQSLTLANDLEVIDSLVVTAGTLILNGRRVILRGHISGTTNMRGSSTSSLIFNGSGVVSNLALAPSYTALKTLYWNRAQALTIAGNIVVNDTIRIDNGSVNTGSNTLTLGTTGVMVGETDTRYVQGTVATTRTLAQNVANSFGNLGATINAAGANPGSTILRRVVGTAPQGQTGNQGVRIIYEVVPTTNSNLNATFTYRYFNDATILGINSEATLVLYRSTDNGVTWVRRGASSRNTVNRTLTLSGVMAFSQWTAASEDNPLPVSFVSLNGTRKGNNLDLKWHVAQEQDVRHYSIMASRDNKTFEEVARIEALGNTLGRRTYSHNMTLTDAGYTYFYVQAVDESAHQDYSTVIYLSEAGAAGSEPSDIRLFPQPSRGDLNVAISGGDQLEEVTAVLTSIDGREVYRNTFVGTSAVINPTDIKPGMYMLQLGTQSWTRKQKVIFE